MRRSQLFAETLRQAPADADAPGYQFLLRGGFVQPLAAGIFTYLPLGMRVKEKVERIMREEMNAIGGQEVVMPVVHPAELWQETGRWYSIGPELARFTARGDRQMVLAMTHEEVIADLLRRQVQSYRQLPIMLYQIQTKFRDEPRARGGMIRAREFTMKDAYSADAGEEGLDRSYRDQYEAYFRIFRRAGIEPVVVGADVGIMGGSGADEFMAILPIGEDQILLCEACGYAANRQIATFRKPQPGAEQQASLEEVATPDAATIAELAAFLGIPESETAKATFFMAGDRFIFAVVRGDMEVNETKLANAVGAADLRPARPEELAGTGIVAGYASPIGVHGVTVVVDDLVAASPNLVAGANREGYHLRNTNYGRDYTADIVTDIASAYAGAPCPRCGEPMRMERAVEVGNIFKLGTRFTEPLGVTFLDEEGREKPIIMGSYGIGVDRLIGVVAEVHHDEKGLIWPESIAPFQVYLVGLDLDDEAVLAAADTLYTQLQARRVEVLYDDRHERAGVKFNDADLLGIPLRITVSRRTVAQAAAEVKRRSETATRLVPLEEVDEMLAAHAEAPVTVGNI
ncbi:MAG TPA: proline--tRNA ligase [Chloroflexota bacterium]|nr:proline--tRNA ligase [Chloroflexota bacterium]